MSVIHIQMTNDISNEMISTLMNLLINKGFTTEKYLGIGKIIIMAKKEQGK